MFKSKSFIEIKFLQIIRFLSNSTRLKVVSPGFQPLPTSLPMKLALLMLGLARGELAVCPGEGARYEAWEGMMAGEAAKLPQVETDMRIIFANEVLENRNTNCKIL